MITSPKIIGLVGRAGAGKTTVANHLVSAYGFTRLAFADGLKDMLIQAGMLTYEECYTRKTEQSRWLLQKIGTEIFRKQVHEDFWIQRMAQRIKNSMDAGSSVVIDDIRFPNEAKLVRAYLGKGVLIKLERTQLDGSPYIMDSANNEHDSERLVDTIQADYIVSAQSGRVDLLIKQVGGILIAK